MNKTELFYYELGKYRGYNEANEEDNYHTSYLNFIENIYDLFSGFGKIHQYYIDSIIEKTINQHGDVVIDKIQEEETVDNIVEYFIYKVIS